MVKEAPFWVLPLNFGESFSDFNLKDFPGSSTAAAALGATSTTSVIAGLGVATVSAMGLYWAWARAESKNIFKVKPLVDPLKQTRKLPDGSRICNNTNNNDLKMYAFVDARTLYEIVRRGARVSNNGPMLGYRSKEENEPYVWLSYNEVIDKSVKIAKGLRYLGLPAGQETFIGVFSKNRPEWVMVEQATYAFKNVLVPLYETLGPDASIFIINQANIKIVFCDTIEKIQGLLNKKADCNCIKQIVLISDASIPDDLMKKAADVNVDLYTLNEIVEFGNNADVAVMELQPPSSNDLSTICYTSGTTGTPKGVMLTHGNVVADCTVSEYFKYSKLSHKDIMISFLPLAHMFERLVQAAIYTEGGSVGFFRGDIRGLASDIKVLQPTILPAVPRVLNRTYDKILSEVSKSKLTKLIFDCAIALKNREISNSIVRNDTILDKAFKKVRDGLGGKVKLIITGSAPISPHVLTFIRCAMGCMVIEGYGQTECVAACCVTVEGDTVPDHVGVPAPCNIIKLVDVPELGYLAAKNEGEVCIKGTNVFQGYYKMPELTAETIIDGWLHTGDIGRWTDRGTLKIIDRKKHIFKLAQGEYVAPEKIENIYAHSKYVAQCFVNGESLKTCLIGIVVPDPEVLVPAAKSELGLEGSYEELCANKTVKATILADLLEVGKKNGLCSFEQLKDIYVTSEIFTVDNNLLTPTLKTKRPQVKLHFKKQFEEMYEKLD